MRNVRWWFGTLQRLAVAATLSITLAGCAKTEPTAPELVRAEFEVNGSPLVARASAALGPAPLAPLTLWVGVFRDDISIVINVPYEGPGTYWLGPANIRFETLVGGDARTGAYRGSSATLGQLVVTEIGSEGDPIHVEFSFDADHTYRDARFGSTARIRNGKLRAVLASTRPF